MLKNVIKTGIYRFEGFCGSIQKCLMGYVFALCGVFGFLDGRNENRICSFFATLRSNEFED